jgi:hypothetical protein
VEQAGFAWVVAVCDIFYGDKSTPKYDPEREVGKVGCFFNQSSLTRPHIWLCPNMLEVFRDPAELTYTLLFTVRDVAPVFSDSVGIMHRFPQEISYLVCNILMMSGFPDLHWG